MSNGLRARLVGRPRYWGARFDGPFYDTSRDACAELLGYVKSKPPSVIETFIEALHAPAITPFRGRNALAYMTATPAQICAAFDATFAKELAELEKTNGNK